MKKIFSVPSVSGSMLKLIAMITMLIDHIAFFIMPQIPSCMNPFITFFGKGVSLFYICRLIGRIAFPLYCFLLVEGFIHTKDRIKYGVRLLVFALISELAWNFAYTGTLFYPAQNVMFTLFFGYLALCALEYFEGNKLKQAAALIGTFLICSLGRFDYGIRGWQLILVMYLLREKPMAQAVIGSSLLSRGWAAIFAFVPINLYNKERGFMKGTLAKYSGYLFYPVHLALLGILRIILFK